MTRKREKRLRAFASTAFRFSEIDFLSNTIDDTFFHYYNHFGGHSRPVPEPAFGVLI
jgi:hypothetical protein